ncbi:MAG: zinc-ribbon domain-containing protein [Clostridium sp.]|jgi:hypothetical protein|nr:zinc-ribbon domain-containing protein [Clostridium sp.]
MAFFEGIGKRITQTGQEAVQKTKDMAETVKLNGIISDEEKRINNSFLQIGKVYFETHSDDPEPIFAQLLAEIKGSKTKIVQCTERIRQLKGLACCPKCGTEMPLAAPFCICGSPMNNSPSAAIPSPSAESVVAFSGTTAETPAPTPDTKLCPSCGKELLGTAVFCSGCGMKMEG